jgi:hypothetical protein
MHLRGISRKYVVGRPVVPLMWHVQVRTKFICDYVTTLEKLNFFYASSGNVPLRYCLGASILPRLIGL